MIDDERILTGEAIRRLLYRRDVAVARHRSALARTLGITDVEMQALVHLAEQKALSPSASGCCWIFHRAARPRSFGASSRPAT